MFRGKSEYYANLLAPFFQEFLESDTTDSPLAELHGHVVVLPIKIARLLEVCHRARLGISQYPESMCIAHDGRYLTLERRVAVRLVDRVEHYARLAADRGWCVAYGSGAYARAMYSRIYISPGVYYS
jgi:hypothetical protein